MNSKLSPLQLEFVMVSGNKGDSPKDICQHNHTPWTTFFYRTTWVVQFYFSPPWESTCPVCFPWTPQGMGELYNNLNSLFCEEKEQ